MHFEYGVRVQGRLIKRSSYNLDWTVSKDNVRFKLYSKQDVTGVHLNDQGQIAEGPNSWICNGYNQNITNNEYIVKILI